MATRCFCPPDSCAGVRVPAVAETDAAAASFSACALRVLLRFMQELHGRKGHVAQDGHMREEIEMLEHHAHLLPVEVDIAAWGR